MKSKKIKTKRNIQYVICLQIQSFKPLIFIETFFYIQKIFLFSNFPILFSNWDNTLHGIFSRVNIIQWKIFELVIWPWVCKCQINVQIRNWATCHINVKLCTPHPDIFTHAEGHTLVVQQFAFDKTNKSRRRMRVKSITYKCNNLQTFLNIGTHLRIYAEKINFPHSRIFTVKTSSTKVS